MGCAGSDKNPKRTNKYTSLPDLALYGISTAFCVMTGRTRGLRYVGRPKGSGNMGKAESRQTILPDRQIDEVCRITSMYHYSIIIIAMGRGTSSSAQLIER